MKPRASSLQKKAPKAPQTKLEPPRESKEEFHMNYYYEKTPRSSYPDNQISDEHRMQLEKLGWNPMMLDEIIWKESNAANSLGQKYYVSCVSWIFICWESELRPPKLAWKNVMRSATQEEVSMLMAAKKITITEKHKPKILINSVRAESEKIFYDAETSAWIWPLSRLNELEPKFD